MPSYPDNRFIQEFARRTAQNLRDVNAGRPLQHNDTALIGFLLAVFVLPHERDGSGQFMAEILSAYGKSNLEKVVTILRPQEAALDGNLHESGLPKSLADVPEFMRHGTAHLNIKPVSADRQNLTHLLVWNHPHPTKPINWVARVHIRRLRSLALHMLKRLAKGESIDKYEHIDPVAEYERHHGTRDSG
jgi:hypothetical protein